MDFPLCFTTEHTAYSLSEDNDLTEANSGDTTNGVRHSKSMEHLTPQSSISDAFSMSGSECGDSESDVDAYLPLNGKMKTSSMALKKEIVKLKRQQNSRKLDTYMRMVLKDKLC